MNNIPGATNVELLTNDQYPDQWMTQGPAGKWEMNAAGELIQKTAVGTRRGGSGAILVQKIPVTSSIFGLQLTCRPGSKHQVGVVFNLVDEHNFCAFCIDVHSKPNEGYSLLAFSVTDGDYDVISKQNYKGKLPETVTLTLRQAGADLALFFNEVLAYIWSDMFVFGKRIGLYSYKNVDAAFLSFSVIPFPTLSAASEKSQRMAEAPVKNENPILTQPQPPSSQPAEQTTGVAPGNELTKFLGIRKPASKTEIEFTEVFTVPLDSFYTSLYTNSSLGKKGTTDTESVQVETLDLRVKRWYRDMKMILENIEFKKLDIELAAGRVAEFERLQGEQSQNTDELLYGEFVKKLFNARKDYRTAVGDLNALRDQEAILKREIRINGYAIDKTTTQSILDLGYKFEIISQSTGPSLFQPIKIPSDLNFFDDDAWKNIELLLYHQLFDTNTISDKGGQLYEEEKRELTTFKKNRMLAKKEEDLLKEIDNCEALKKILQPSVDAAEKEIADWTADKAALIDQKKVYAQAMKKLNPNWKDENSFPYYFPTVDWDLSYEAELTGVGWLKSKEKLPLSSEDPYPVHPEFAKDFMLQPGYINAARYRLKRFTVDLNFEVYRPYYLFTAAAIYCPTGPGTYLSFYHRMDTSYFNKFNYY